MKLLLPIRFGLRAARRNLRLTVLVYLLSLVPALLVAALAYLDMAPEMDRSLFAGEALAGNRIGVWNDFTRTGGSDFGMVTSALLLTALAVVVLRVLTAAGVVEALLAREHHRERPFLLGVGRHGWRFLRSAVWFAIAVVVLGGLVSLAFTGVNHLAAERTDGALQLWAWIGVLAVAFLLFVPLDLGYDLSRIAAAAHDDRRTFVGFFRALGHALRHLLLLAPVWLLFSLAALGLHLAYVTGRAFVQPSSLAAMALVVVAQQAVFLAAAFLRVALWGGEIAYYQAAGEPRWCGRKRRRAEG
jgi:hypothetical protein